jgi:hypothetical protein
MVASEKIKKIFFRFELARQVVEVRSRTLFCPGLHEVLIAEYHDAPFRFCQENANEA